MKTRLQDFYNYLLRNEWANPEAALPAKASAEAKKELIKNRIEKMKSLFGDDTISKSEQPAFRMLLRALNASYLEQALFGNATQELKPSYMLPAEDTLREQFKALEFVYNYLPDATSHEAAFAKFKIFFIISKTIGDFVEHNNQPNNSVAYLHAYKLLIAFGDKDEPHNLFQPIDTYLKTHNFINLKNPLHDALVSELPERTFKRQIKLLPQWRNLIQTSGTKGFALFNRAFDIEVELEKQYPELSDRNKILSNYKSASNFAATITYKNAMEYEELAELFMRYRLSNELFEQARQVDKQRKKADHLPDTLVDGTEIGFPGYYLVKLPTVSENPNDKYRALGYVLGHITNCCQSIGGASEACVIDGITKSQQGFLLLLKDTSGKAQKIADEKVSPTTQAKKLIDNCRIMGQGYLWTSNWDNLVIDSWENLNKEDDKIAAQLLKKYGEKVLAEKDSKILRVNIGDGGKTPDGEFKSYVSAEHITDGYQYPDSTQQKLVAIDTDKQKKLYEQLQTQLQDIIHEKIDSKLNLSNFLNPDHILSAHHAEVIKNIFQDPSYQQFLKKISPTIVSANKDHNYFFIRFWSTLGALHEAKICPTEEYFDNFFKKSMDYFPRAEVTRAAQELASANSALLQEHFLHALGKANLLDSQIFETFLKEGFPSFLFSSDKPIILAILEHADRTESSTEVTDKYRIKILDLFLHKGANPNEKDFRGQAPIHKAFDLTSSNRKNLKLTILGKLIEAKADPNLLNRESKTPLRLALDTRDMDSIKLLLNAKANPNIYESDGYTLFHHLLDLEQTRTKSLEIIQIFLEAKADLTLSNATGSAIHTLVSSYSHNNLMIEVMTLLLERKADINVLNSEGETPALIAVKKENPIMLKWLLANGADKPKLIYDGQFDNVPSQYLDWLDTQISKIQQAFTPLKLNSENSETCFKEWIKKSKLDADDTTSECLRFYISSIRSLLKKLPAPTDEKNQSTTDSTHTTTDQSPLQATSLFAANNTNTTLLYNTLYSLLHQFENSDTCQASLLFDLKPATSLIKDSFDPIPTSQKQLKP